MCVCLVERRKDREERQVERKRVIQTKREVKATIPSSTSGATTEVAEE